MVELQAPLTVRAKQLLFAKLLGQLMVWVPSHPGWGFRMAEGYVGDSINDPHETSPHMRQGQHFRRLAQDFILEVDGVIKVTDCPEWQAIGAYWKSLHKLCRWGGDFVDAQGRPRLDLDHFSLEHLGFA